MDTVIAINFKPKPHVRVIITVDGIQKRYHVNYEIAHN